MKRVVLLFSTILSFMIFFSVALGEFGAGVEAQATEILVRGYVGASITEPNLGEPLAGIKIVLVDNNNPDDFHQEAVTDGNGWYTVTQTLYDTWWIRFEPPAGSPYFAEYYRNTAVPALAKVFTTSPGMELIEVNARLTSRGQSQITGQVTSAIDGTPLREAKVQPYDASGTLMEDDITFTDSNGYYTITELALGTYRLYFDGENAGPYYVPEYYNDKATLAEAAPVEVNSLHVGGVDVALAEGGAIHGIVSSEWNNWGLDRAQTFVYDANGKIVGEGFSDWQEPGGFTVANLAPGAYRLRFVDADNFHRSEYYDNAQSLEQATPVMVTAGETTAVKAKLTLIDTQTIVSVATAKGAPNAIIVAYGHDRAPHFTLDSGQHWQRVTAIVPWSVPDGYPPDQFSVSEVGLVARSESEGGVRFLYSDSHDLYTSDNLGQSWTKHDIGSCVEAPAIEGFVTSPTNPTQIYLYQSCTVHDPFFTQYYQWLWYSADGGDTWQDQYSEGGWLQAAGAQIVPSPVVSGRLYVNGTESWLYRDESEKPWETRGFPVLTVVPDATEDEILYGWSSSAAPKLVGMRSEDSGEHWQNWEQQPCPTPFRLLAHPTESEVLLVRCQEGLFGSEDGGDSWRQLTTTPGQRIAPDFGTSGRILWVLENGKIAASSDSGKSWKTLAVQLPLYLPSVASD